MHANVGLGDAFLRKDAERRKAPVEGRSANHFELAFTDSEFLLDFGQAYDNAEAALLHTRIIMTPRSAKTLLRMLKDLVARYESQIAPIPDTERMN
jgi:hypothetical protein